MSNCAPNFKGLDFFENDHEEDDSPTTHHQTANTYSSLATAYLGSTGSAEADAGIQYYNGDRYDPGWGAFIKAGSGNTSTPKVYDGTTWSGVHAASTSFDLEYYIDESDGSVWVKVSGLEGITDAFPYPDDPRGYLDKLTPTTGDVFPADEDKLSDIYDTNNLDSVRVKRVVGITQGARTGQDKNTFTYALDGSITTIIYENGWVRENGASWTHWSPSIVYQTPTGYDAGQDEKDAQWSDQDTLKSQYILTFPNIDELRDIDNNVILSAAAARAKARMDTPQSYTLTEGGNSRYVHETLKISLRSATKITGEKSKPRSASQ